jgi:hypothetical protein
VFFFVLYSMGLRISEGLALTAADIDAERGRVHIRDSKGNRDRFVPLPLATLTVLRRFWHEHRNPVLMFPNRGGGVKALKFSDELAVERLVLSGYAATQERLALRLAAIAMARGLEACGRSPFASLQVAAGRFSITPAELECDVKRTAPFPISEWYLILASDDELEEIRAAGDLMGGRPTVLWALAVENLGAADRTALFEASARARRSGDAAALGEVRRLYDRAGVTAKATTIAAEQRRLAAETVAACGLPRLREVLEFLLDLAVPAGATDPR